MDRTIDRSVQIGLGLLVVLLLGTATVTYYNTARLNEDAAWVAHTQEVRDSTADLLRLLVDAETGERGFVITGQDVFLQPFEEVRKRLDDQIAALQALTADNPDQQDRIRRLRMMAADEFALIGQSIALRRKSEKEAQAFVASGQGKAQMDAIRGLIADMKRHEHDLLREGQRRSHTAFTIAVTSGFLTAALGVLFVGLFYRLLRRNLAIRQQAAAELHAQKEWLRTTLGSIGDGVIATDTEGKVTFLNGVAQRLTGWSQAEALAQPLETIFRIIHEDTGQPVENPALRTLREGKVVGLANHTLLVAKDGTECALDDSAAPTIDEKGRVIGAVLVFRDVGERRNVEQALR